MMERRRLWQMWWSGLFAAAACVHVLRTLANVPVVIGTMAIPIWVGWVVFPLAGFVSGWLMRIALKRRSEPIPLRPSAIVPGGLHPKSMSREELEPAGQRERGSPAKGPDWGDDWMDD